MTLARYFIRLRSNAGMSLRAVGAKCKPKLDAVTVWKVENARPIKAKTLAQILHAIGLTERDEEYLKAFAYWSTEQAQTLSHAQTSCAKCPRARPNWEPHYPNGRNHSPAPARSWTALMWAAHCGHVDVMVALMHCGADQSKRVPHGRYSGCALANFSYGRQSCTQH